MLNWPTPKKVKDIQKFLKLANYYQQFIKDLHNLVKKDWKQDWTEKQEKTFKKLKEIFIQKPVLVALDLDKKMRMEVDTLNYIMGEVLSMKCKDR